MKSAAETYAEIPNYPTSGRLLLPLNYIEHMPIKEVTPDELYELKTHWDYNPIHVGYGYCKGDDISKFKYLEGEHGYDQRFRYILVK